MAQTIRTGLGHTENEVTAGLAAAKIGEDCPWQYHAAVFAIKWLLASIGGLFLALIGFYAADARAQNLPNFTPAIYCQGMARIGVESSRETYQECFNLERLAQQVLRSQWETVPSNVRDRCIRAATIGLTGSYSTLQGCIGIEVSAPAPRPELAPSHRSLLVHPPNEQGTAYESIDQCLEAREKLLPEIAVCMRR
jgi:hypothetical protein